MVRSSRFFAVMRSAARRALRSATSSRKRFDSSVERPVMNCGRLPGCALVISIDGVRGVREVQQGRPAAERRRLQPQPVALRLGDVTHRHVGLGEPEISGGHHGSGIGIVFADHGGAFSSPHTSHTKRGRRAALAADPSFAVLETRRMISRSSPGRLAVGVAPQIARRATDAARAARQDGRMTPEAAVPLPPPPVARSATSSSSRPPTAS